MNTQNATIWVIVEAGLTGTENQCLGVCDALGVTPIIKHISLRQPWKAIAPYILWGIGYGIIGDDVSAPWPDIVITGGRKGAAVALWVKQQNPRTFVVCLQDPRAKHSKFDLIAAPAHDALRGPNVIQTIGAPNRINLSQEEKLGKGGQHVAVLLGGNSNHHRFTNAIAQKLGHDLRALESQGYHLMITASRRTPDKAKTIIQSALNTQIWDGAGENPYKSYLTRADYILVTNDSVSMMSDAASTGKPVYRIDLKGNSKRLDAFHALLEHKKIARPFTGQLETYTYTPLQDAQHIAGIMAGS